MKFFSTSFPKSYLIPHPCQRNHDILPDSFLFRSFITNPSHRVSLVASSFGSRNRNSGKIFTKKLFFSVTSGYHPIRAVRVLFGPRLAFIRWLSGTPQIVFLLYSTAFSGIGINICHYIVLREQIGDFRTNKPYIGSL